MRVAADGSRALVDYAPPDVPQIAVPTTLSSATKRRPPPSDWRPRVEKAVQADAMIHLILHQRGERVPVAMPGERVPGAEQ